MMQIRNPRKESRRNRKLTKGKRIKSRSVGNGGRRRREKEEKRVTKVSDDEEGGGERGLMLNGHVNVRRFHSRGLIYSKKQESGKGSFMSANGSSSSSFTSSSSSCLSFFFCYSYKTQFPTIIRYFYAAYKQTNKAILGWAPMYLCCPLPPSTQQIQKLFHNNISSKYTFQINDKNWCYFLGH